MLKINIKKYSIMKINWNYPTSVWVGENRIKDLSQACKNLDISKPLFVTEVLNFILSLKFPFLTLPKI